MKHVRQLLILFLFVFAEQLSAQNYHSVIGANNRATGGTGTANVDLWSANNNQASMAFYEAGGGAGFYYQNSFMIKEMALRSGALIYPTKSGAFGLTISNYGSTNFNTNKIGLGYGKKLSERFSAGIQLDYINIYIGDNYGSKGLFTFELGILAKATDKINIGAHVFNPIRAKIMDYNDERLPVVMNLGVQWKANKYFVFSAEAESDINSKMILKTGIEYRIIDMLYARIGISNNPNIVSFGAGLHLGNFRLDFSSSMHQVLGYSPQFSFIYELDK